MFFFIKILLKHYIINFIFIIKKNFNVCVQTLFIDARISPLTSILKAPINIFLNNPP